MNEDERTPERPPSLEGFRRIFEENVDYVHHSLRRLGAPASDLDDAVQEVFIVFYRRRAVYDPSRPVRLWLFGIAVRIAASRRRRAVTLATEELAPLVDLAPLPDARLDADRQRERVLAALLTIGEERRPVFVMHEVDGFTMPEIASELGIPLNTAYSRLRVARAEFRRAVERQAKREER